ncbi:MAG: hypothetical protein R3A13_00475 [Bdellovibrionota bacterium]
MAPESLEPLTPALSRIVWRDLSPDAVERAKKVFEVLSKNKEPSSLKGLKGLEPISDFMLLREAKRLQDGKWHPARSDLERVSSDFYNFLTGPFYDEVKEFVGREEVRILDFACGVCRKSFVLSSFLEVMSLVFHLIRLS